MKQCVTPNALTEVIFKKSVRDLLFGNNGLFEQFINEGKGKGENPYLSLFKYPNESISDYKQKNGDDNAIFKYRAKLYLINWYNKTYGDYISDKDITYIYNEFKNSLKYTNVAGSTQGTGMPIYISSLYSNSIAKLVVSNFAEVSKYVKDNKVTYRDAIINLFLDKVIQFSEGRITLARESISNMVYEDLNSANSVIYPEILDILSKQYGINIKTNRVLNKVDIAKLEEIASSEEDSPISWNYSDNFSSDVVSGTMTRAFKIKLSRAIDMSNKKVSDISYLPNYINGSQLSNMISILHANDDGYSDFLRTIRNVAKYEPAFAPLLEIFESVEDRSISDTNSENAQFVQQYIHIFTTAHTSDVIVDNDNNMKVLNASSNPNNYIFYKLVDRLKDDTTLEQLQTIPIVDGVINAVYYKDILDLLGFYTYAEGILDTVDENLSPFPDADKFFNSIVAYANATKFHKKEDISSDFKVKGLSNFIRRASSFPMWYINLQYINDKGNKVYTPTKPSYITEMTKGLVTGNIMTGNYARKGRVNTDRVLSKFKHILNDPTLKNSPLLRNNGDDTSIGIFSDSNEIVNDSFIQSLSNVFRLSSYQGLEYRNIFSSKSYDFIKMQLEKRIYVIPASDANSTYAITYPDYNYDQVVQGLMQIVLVDRDVFINGLDLVNKGSKENPLKYDIPNGQAYKFKETAYTANGKQNNYLEFLINNELITNINSLQDLIDIYNNDRDSFNMLFESNYINEYITQWFNDMLYDANSEFIKLYGSDISTDINAVQDLFAQYFSRFIVGHTMNVMFTGSQAEYKSDTAFNKRANHIGRKKSVINELLDDNYKVVIFDDIVIDSPVTDQLVKQLPHLKSVFENQNSTDGISYITDITLEKILKNEGKWAEYKPIVEDLRNGRLIDPDKYKVLVEQLKMFAYARRNQSTIVKTSNDQSLASYQIKDSTVVLFRSSIEGTEFEKIYDFLIDNKIDQISSKANVKVGFVSPIRIHNKQGNLDMSSIEDILKDGKLDEHTLYLSMRDFGPQQDNTSHVLDKDTTLPTQLVKKAISDLNATEAIYKFQNHNVDGNTIDGIVQQSLTVSIDHKVEELLYKLGAYDDNGKVNYANSSNEININFDKFKEVLKDLILNRDVPNNIKAILDLDIPSDSVLLSLPTVYNAFKYILISQFNDVINRSLPGTHVTIVPDVFRNPINSDSELPSKGVSYTEAFLKDVKVNRNGSYRLREEYGYNAKNVEHKLGDKESTTEDKFHYAEIIINPYHFDIFADHIKTRVVERMIDGKLKKVKEKYVDTTNIDESVLTMLATRIPVDSKSSVMVFKVVGFAMDGSSKAFVPSGLINRTGWDFDNDTIYTFHNHVITVDDTLTAITKDNAYNDLQGGKFEAYLDRVNPQWRTDLLDQIIKGIDLRKIGLFISDYVPSYSTDTILSDNVTNTLSIQSIDLLQDSILTIIDRVYMDDNKKADKAYSEFNKEFARIHSAIKNIKSKGVDLIDFISDAKNKQNRLSVTEKRDIRKNTLDVINNIAKLSNAIIGLQDLATSYGFNEDTMTAISNIVGFTFNIGNEQVNILDVISEINGKYEGLVSTYLESNNKYKKSFNALSPIHQESQEVVDNDLLEAYMAIFKSIEHIQERNRSNNSDTLKSAAEVVTRKSNPIKYSNFNSPYVQAQYQDGNMSIGALKSISVNIDGIFAIMQRIGARFDKTGIKRTISRQDFPRNEEGTIIELNEVLLNKAVGLGNYSIQRIDGVIEKVIIYQKYIANDAQNTKKSILGNPMNDYISEVTPAIFDSVNVNVGFNINTKTITLFKILAASPIVEYDGKNNNSFMYAMSFVHHPIVVAFTQQAIETNVTLDSVVNEAYKDLSFDAIDNAEYYSTSELLAQYDGIDDASISNIIVMLKSYLDAAKDFNNVAMTLKTEKNIRGDYGVISRNLNIIKAIADPSRLTSRNIRNYIKDINSNIDQIAMEIKPTFVDNSNPSKKDITEFKRTVKGIMNNISTFESLMSFISNNPNLYNLIRSDIGIMKNGTYQDIVTAMFPSVIGSQERSVNPYIESNLINAYNMYRNMFGDIFAQHNTDVYNVASYIAKKLNRQLSEKEFSAILDSIVNYNIHRQFNLDTIVSEDIDDILTKTGSKYSKSENETLKTIGYKQLIISNTAKTAEYRTLHKGIIHRLSVLKKNLTAKGISISDINVYSDPNISAIFEDFKALTTVDKLNVIRYIFNDYIDSKNVLHSRYIDSVKKGHYTSLRYNEFDSLIVDEHSASFEESLRHPNLFISYTARDIILNNVFTNGFQFGFNIGKLIPVSFLSEEYANDMGHPAELLHEFAQTQMNTVDSIQDIFEDIYYRQNIDMLSTMSVSNIKEAGFKSYQLISENDKPLGYIYIGRYDSVASNAKLLNNNYINIPTTAPDGITRINRLYRKLRVADIINEVIDNGTELDIDIKKYSDYYVIVPANSLLKSEFGDVSMLDQNNVRSIDKGAYTPLEIMRLITSESINVDGYANSIFEIIDNDINDRIQEELDAIEMEADDEIGVSDISLGAVEFENEMNEDDSYTETTELSTVDNIAAQVAQITNIILNSIQSTINHNLDGTEINPIISRMRSIVNKDNFTYDDPALLRQLISNIIEFNNKSVNKLKRNINKLSILANDPKTFANEAIEGNAEGRSNYIEYATILEESYNLSLIIEKISTLNIEGIDKLSRGFVEVIINDTAYLVITNKNLFDRHANNSNLDPNLKVITSLDEYKTESIKNQTKVFVDLIDNGYFKNEDGSIDHTKTYSYASGTSVIDFKYNDINIIIKALTLGYNDLSEVEKKSLFIIDDDTHYRKLDGNDIPNTVSTIMRYINISIESKYEYVITKNSEYDDIINKIIEVRNSMSSITPMIDNVKKHQNEFVGKTLGVQSRHIGLLFAKIKEELIANGHSATEEDVIIAHKELNDFVIEYMANDKNKEYVTRGIKHFGTPFNTTDPRIDIILKQYFLSRTRNREVSKKYDNEYKALLKEYDIKPTDTDIFENGNIIGKFKYSEIKEIRSRIYNIIKNGKIAYWNTEGELSYTKRKEALQETQREARALIAELYGLDSKQLRQIIVLQKAVSRKQNIEDIDEKGLFEILFENGKFTKLNESGIETLSKDEYEANMKNNDFDANQYINITRLFGKGKSDPKDQIYLKFNYDAKYINNKYTELEKTRPNVIEFVNKYDILMKELYSTVGYSYNKERNVLPFIPKTTTAFQLKSYMGWRSISRPATYKGIDDEVHYITDVNKMFKLGHYSEFNNNYSEISVTDVSNDDLVLSAFREWYDKVDKDHRIEIDLPNLTLEMIDDYNERVAIANDKYKADHQLLDLDIITNHIIEGVEKAKTVNEFDTVVTASGIRKIGTPASKRMIDLATKNASNGTLIGSKAEQYAGVLLRGASLNFMALNYLSGMKNVLKGTLNIIEESSSKGLYDGKDLRLAVGNFINNIARNAHKLKNNPDDNRTIALFRYLDDVFEDTRDTVTGAGLTKAMKWVDSILYSPNQLGEIMMQYSMTIANAKSHRVIKGKIMTYSEYSNDYQNSLFKEMLTKAQLREYSIYKALLNKKQKESTKYVSNVDNSLNDFIQKLRSSNSDIALTKEQVRELNNIRIKVKSAKTEFNKAPTVEASLISVNGEIEFAKNSLGKPVFTKEEFGNFIRRVSIINQNLHGIYNRLDRSALQTMAFGEIILQFRKWMYPNYARYVGKHYMKNSFNEASGLIETPIFKPVNDLIKTMFSMKDNNIASGTTSQEDITKSIKNIGINLISTIANIRSYYNALPTYEQAAMLRSLKTITIIVVTGTVASIVAGGLKDRDEEEHRKLLATASYVLDGLFNEWSILIPVYGQYTEYKQFKQKLFVSEGVLLALNDLTWYGMVMPAIYDENDPEYKKMYYSRGARKGQSKASVAFKKLVPVWKQIEKQMSIEEYSKFYNLNNMFIQAR